MFAIFLRTPESAPPSSLGSTEVLNSGAVKGMRRRSREHSPSCQAVLRDQEGLGIGRTSVRHSFVRHVVAAGLVATLAAGVVLTATAHASARVPSRPSSLAAASSTPQEIIRQVQAAQVLSAGLQKSDAMVAAASSRLEALSARANTLSANLPATRTAQVAAETKAVDYLANSRQTACADTEGPGLQPLDNAERPLRQRLDQLLQRLVAIKCTVRPVCRSRSESASRRRLGVRRDEECLPAADRVGAVRHRGLPFVRRAGRGQAETPRAGSDSGIQQTRTWPRG